MTSREGNYGNSPESKYKGPAEVALVICAVEVRRQVRCLGLRQKAAHFFICSRSRPSRCALKC